MGWYCKIGDKIRTQAQLTELQGWWDTNFGATWTGESYYDENENWIPVWAPGPKEPLTSIPFSFIWSHNPVHYMPYAWPQQPNYYDGLYVWWAEIWNAGRPWTGASPWRSTRIIRAHRPTHVGQWAHEFQGYYTYEEMTETYADLADVHFQRTPGQVWRREGSYRAASIWDPNEEWWYTGDNGQLVLAFRGCWVADYSQPWQEWISYNSNSAWYNPMPLTEWGAIIMCQHCHTGLEYFHGEYPSWYPTSGNMWKPDPGQWTLP